jgi:type II secretory pathway pseudopilin PulG
VGVAGLIQVVRAADGQLDSVTRNSMTRSKRQTSLRSGTRRRAFTLMELLLVIGLMVVLTAMAMPALFSELQRSRLPESAERMRSLLTMVRAQAQWSGLRHRLRFPTEDDDEEDLVLGLRQPIIEREDDPIEEPEEWTIVREPWAIDETMQPGIRCVEVRLGKPTLEGIRDARERRNDISDLMEERFEEFEAERPPLIIEPDGTSEWATFVLTDAPEDMELDDLNPDDLDAEEDEIQLVEIILDGELGFVWLQRPFYEEELDLFEEENWPVLMRTDYLDSTPLSEDNVLELYESRMKPTGME